MTRAPAHDGLPRTHLGRDLQPPLPTGMHVFRAEGTVRPAPTYLGEMR